MEVTVEQLMSIDVMKKCKVVAGKKGLHREVTIATIMEVPDIVQWLKRKEFILTSLYPIKDDEAAQARLIRSLYESGASAIAIKPRRFVQEIPPIILKEAEKYHFPVIEIPEEISYIDILIPVMNMIYLHKNKSSKDIEETNQMLNEISLVSEGIDDVVEMLTNLTENRITVESQLPYIELLPISKDYEPLTLQQANELKLVKRPIQLKRKYKGKETDCFVAPIFIDRELCGTITSWGFHHKPDVIDWSIVEKSITILTLEFLKLKVKYDVEQQYKNEFLRDLLFNEHIRADVFFERGKKYNLSRKYPYICFVLELAEDDSLKKNELEAIIQRINPAAVSGRLKNCINVLYPLEEDPYKLDCKALVEKFYADIQARLINTIHFRLGVGGYYPGIKGLRKSYQEATKALALSVTKDDIVYYDELGIYSLIGQIRDKEELHLFYEQTVGVLVDYDENNELQLFQTLRTYFEHDEALNKTAESLYIHVNTLKYRLKRIEELTDLNLQSTHDKMMLYLGIKVYELLLTHHPKRQ